MTVTDDDRRAIMEAMRYAGLYDHDDDARAVLWKAIDAATTQAFAAGRLAGLEEAEKRSDTMHGQLQRLIDRWEALTTERDALRSDINTLVDADFNCMKCAAPLFDGDHIHADNEGDRGCWHAFIPPEKAGNAPCYKYRALKDTDHD